MRFVAMVIMLAIWPAGSVSAQSADAKTIIKKQIREACGKRGGRMRKGGAIHRDLTGDGKTDLIISHEAIACRSNQRSGFCGAQVCSVNIFVSRKGRLRLAKETLGGGVKVGRGKRPVIKMAAGMGRTAGMGGGFGEGCYAARFDAGTQ